MTNVTAVKTTLENNYRVTGSPLLKMAIDCITDLENQIKKMRRCDTECKNLSKWEFQSD